MNTAISETEELITESEQVDVIVNICDKMIAILLVLPISQIQNSEIIDKFTETLELIAEAQITQFEKTALATIIDSSSLSERSTILLKPRQATSFINITDSLFSLNLTECQVKNVLERSEKIIGVMIVSLQANSSPGETESIAMTNTQITYTVENGLTFGEYEYEFDGIKFPMIKDKLNNKDLYGLSRTIWKMNPYTSTINTDNLVVNMSAITRPLIISLIII